MQLWECITTTGKEQAFILHESGVGRIRYAFKDEQCLDVRNHMNHAGTSIQTWKCEEDNLDQIFDFGFPDPEPKALMTSEKIQQLVDRQVHQAQAWGFELLPWYLAEEKAERTLSEMKKSDIFGLLRGLGMQHWQAPGWYVGNTQGVPDLRVPGLLMQDASNGFRDLQPGTQGTMTSWPAMLALAATWDEKLVEGVARAIGQEFRGKGANVILGPSVNVHRVAKGGRNFEYLSGEDPYLGSRLTRAYVHGVHSEGVMAVVKHFGFNEQETNRGYGDAIVESSNVDAATARNLYYPPFEAAISAGVCSFMCSYNQVNGTFACGNKQLLQDDLKQEMGFRGFVMSDWDAAHGPNLSAGLDMEMPGSRWFTDESLSHIRELDLRASAKRVLAATYRLRLDEKDVCVPPSCDQITSYQRSEIHSEIALAAASAAVTLLKNADDLLPLRPSRVGTIAILGPAASATPANSQKDWQASDYFNAGGSGHVFATHAVNAFDGIRERAEQLGIKVVTDIATADVAIVVAAATSTEGKDRETLALDWGADSLIQKTADTLPTIVLMQTPGVVTTPWRDSVNAILNLFLAGEATGSAWAAVIFGDVTPSGKLPVMFPASEADTIEPGFAPSLPYGEGLFTSYRSRVFKAAFPFGHGLSYTRFQYESPSLVEGSGGRWSGPSCTAYKCVQVTIMNVGERSGVEVAQAYIQFVASELDLPSKMLRGFHKTRLLAPGESETATFTLSERDLSVYDAMTGWQLQTQAHLYLGSSSKDIRLLVRLSDGSSEIVSEVEEIARLASWRDPYNLAWFNYVLAGLVLASVAASIGAAVRWCRGPKTQRWMTECRDGGLILSAYE
eukprot:TRINITY_DN106020_c0_g1_i1.p1 TRINITY_DN106020_c0_g1~~TRINITY_DN106020_c0_g1_i1.p1  ORF type:complete len:947 (-),score=146.77 TRINITY_DN106020_c0_g1_i1:44-2575(-)